MLRATELLTEVTAMLEPLDDALEDLRITGSVILHEAYRAPWAISVPDEARLRSLIGAGTDQRAIPFHLVRLGGFRLEAAGNDGLAAGTLDLSLVPGGVAHCLYSGSRNGAWSLETILSGGGPESPEPGAPESTELVCGAFVMRAAPLNPLIAALPSVFKVATGGAVAAPALAAAATLLAAELARGSRGGFTARRLLEVVFAEAIRSWQASHAETRPGWFRSLTDAKVSAALRCIHQAPQRPWTLATLADTVALSPSRFAARFREASGESVMAYLARWRINLACRHLSESDRPIADVAERVGYESAAAFSRMFKSLTGRAPGEWRREHKERGGRYPPVDR